MDTHKHILVTMHVYRYTNFINVAIFNYCYSSQELLASALHACKQ